MNQRGIIIALYINNILVFRKDEKSINATKTKLKAFHPMKDSGLVKKILGIRVAWHKDRISLDQEVYAEQILEEFRMGDSKPQKLPLSPSINLNEDSPRLTRELYSEYRHVIGWLTYLAGGTRPDLQKLVNRLSQYLTDPTEVHYKAIKHILRYLRGTIEYSISYEKGSNDKLVGYSDAAYGNSVKQRSTSGYVFILVSGLVSWSSRKQPITATLLLEAEYIAAADAAK